MSPARSRALSIRAARRREGMNFGSWEDDSGWQEESSEYG
jgi:hypothetical protein